MLEHWKSTFNMSPEGFIQRSNIFTGKHIKEGDMLYILFKNLTSSGENFCNINLLLSWYPPLASDDLHSSFNSRDIIIEEKSISLTRLTFAQEIVVM